MSMSDASLKGKIKNIAKANKLSAQEVLQMYLFERFITRLEASDYSDHFILKGGLLIASITGISQRTTMDMDGTLRNISMEEDDVVAMIKEICSLTSEDGIKFSYKRIEPIREDDEYSNYRVHIVAVQGKIEAPMKIDLTTGDVVTPEAIHHSFKLMFEEGSVDVMAYTLETIIAEKFETVIHRTTTNSRARDFYDLHILLHMKAAEIDWAVLRDAVDATASKRGSLALMSKYRHVCAELASSDYMENVVWATYTSDNPYAEGLAFQDIIKDIEAIGAKLELDVS